jgi:L-arabinose isomerase
MPDEKHNEVKGMGLISRKYNFWFCVGSQDLYGEECLRHVADHGAQIAEGINHSGSLPYPLVFKPVLISADMIRETFVKANEDRDCAGVITWMHTFSPAKSWIAGLKVLDKPLLHFHTQFNEEIPYDKIDMDFMNENQSAHGGREYGHIVTRMGIARKVVTGHWKNPSALRRIAAWMRTAVGIVESCHIRVMRMADNMRNVAVTEGDKVEAQIKFGWQVDAWPVTELADAVAAVSTGDVNALLDEYYSRYDIVLDGRDPREFRDHVAVQAQIELGFERFLKAKDYHAIVTHFDDLGTLRQLPGLAIQRLMEKGYGFGAEGDWKTAALVRLMKLMSADIPDAKGTSMLEDYTYNLVPGKEGILQAHMLEICPTLSQSKPAIRCQPLSMGRREDPVRLVFTSKTGPGVAVSLIDMGTRFRMIIAEVDCKANEKPMPRLPVATVFWTPRPDFVTGVEAWILAGGAHHTAFSYDLTAEMMSDWAENMGVEALVIDKDTTIRGFKQEIMLGRAFYR